jgi:hypothetical protein
MLLVVLPLYIIDFTFDICHLSFDIYIGACVSFHSSISNVSSHPSSFVFRLFIIIIYLFVSGALSLSLSLSPIGLFGSVSSLLLLLHFLHFFFFHFFTSSLLVPLLQRKKARESKQVTKRAPCHHVPFVSPKQVTKAANCSPL